MTQTKLRTMGLLALVGALTVPAKARAQAVVPPVVPPAKILVLGLYENNKLEPGRRQQVAATIIDEQLGTALQPGLEEKDLSCLKASCLEDLAKQWNEADYIVGGATFATPDKVQYEIQVWLYRVNITPEERLQGVQRQFSARRICKTDEYPTCLTREVESLIKSRPAQERLRVTPSGSAGGTLAAEESAALSTVRTKTTCSRWNFARAATLGASVGVLGSGLIAGTFVASLKGFTTDQGSLVFSEQGYSAIGFGAAALALIPGGLALGRPSLFSPGNSADGGCVSATQTRWTTARGAAVGLFSGLLASGLVALIGTAANQNSHCIKGSNIPCDFTSNIAIGGALSATWALGLTLSLVIPSRAGGP